MQTSLSAALSRGVLYPGLKMQRVDMDHHVGEAASKEVAPASVNAAHPPQQSSTFPVAHGTPSLYRVSLLTEVIQASLLTFQCEGAACRLDARRPWKSPSLRQTHRQAASCLNCSLGCFPAESIIRFRFGWFGLTSRFYSGTSSKN